MKRRAWLWPPALVVLAAACSGGGAPGGTGVGMGAPPTVVVSDSVVLEENDSLYLGDPAYLAPLSSGGYLVTDGMQARVVHFDADGRLVGVIGNKGRGPGEFASPFAVIERPDGTIAVSDAELDRISVFDATHELMFDVSTAAIVRDAALIGPDVWLAGTNQADATGLTRWTADTVLRSSLPIPDTYRAIPPLAGIHHAVQLDAWGDSLLVAFSGTSEIMLAGPDGVPVAAVTVPAVRRKGVTREALQKMANPATPFPEMFSAISALFGLHRRSDGSIMAVHFDQVLDGNAIESEVFASLLSADRTRACVDAPVALVGETQPVIAFRGDTLLVLEQLTQSEPVVTVIRKLLVEDDACAWQPITES
ncbi:MAG TPA: 6-bladed beta-propeller [Gemmatimonadales bacterium]|nr:6-bladed beta-propeller [Gemmatimonadales bacterium]